MIVIRGHIPQGARTEREYRQCLGGPIEELIYGPKEGKGEARKKRKRGLGLPLHVGRSTHRIGTGGAKKVEVPSPTTMPLHS